MITIANPSNPSFMRRHRRLLWTNTILFFVLSAVVTMFTPPTFQAIALISLPAGVTADQVTVHLLTDAMGVVPPESRPLSDFQLLVRAVGHDSPAVAALIVEGDHVNGLAEVADNWASIAVEKLGDQAAVMTHAETPRYAVRPKKAQNILSGTILGLMLGLLIAVRRERSKRQEALQPAADSAKPTPAGAN